MGDPRLLHASCSSLGYVGHGDEASTGVTRALRFGIGHGKITVSAHESITSTSSCGNATSDE